MHTQGNIKYFITIIMLLFFYNYSVANFKSEMSNNVINTSNSQIQQKGWPFYMGNGCEAGVGPGSSTYADLDSDGDLEIIVGGRDANVYAWHHDGTIVAGWPFQTNSYIVSSPAVGDINNDGFPEIVVSSNDGYLYALSHNGSILAGWPILVDRVYSHVGGSHSQGSPALADVDGNSFLDIIYNSKRYGKTFIFNYLGQNLQGWPQNYLSEEFTFNTPAIADLDHDGKVEIIVAVFFTQDGGPNYNKIYVWHSDGTLMAGWPKIFEDYWYSWFNSPIIGDVNGDSNLDIVAADLQKVYVLGRNGNMLNGWPFEMDFDLGGHNVALANFDDDSKLEIAATSADKIYLLDDYATIMNGFPVIMDNTSQVAIADIDYDGKNEVICGNDYPSNSLYAWNDDGSIVTGFPLNTNGFIKSTPLILDIDSDGDVEIAIGECGQQAGALYFYVWDLNSSYNPSMVEWHMFQHDPHNTGSYEFKMPSFLLDIKGRLEYYSDQTVAVDDGIIQLTGTITQQDTSNTSGNYEFQGLISGNYVVTPRKSNDRRGAVTVFDASFVLRYSVGYESLTPYQKIAADVSGNGEVSVYDAALILRVAVGTDTTFPAGDWTFVPQNYAINDTNWSISPRSHYYTPLESDQFNQDFMSILYGDVSGNWTGIDAPDYNAIVEINIGDIQYLDGGKWRISVELKSTIEAYSGSFKFLSSNPDLKFIFCLIDNSLTNNVLFTSNSSPGKVNFSFASTEPLNNQAIKIDFVVEELKPVTPSISDFQIVDVIIDDQEVTITMVENQSRNQLPLDWHLGQNSPNPFNPETLIGYQIPKTSHVTIEVFNLIGQRLRILVDEEKNPGTYQAMWNGLDDLSQPVSSGIYLYKIQTANFTAIKKMVLVR